MRRVLGFVGLLSGCRIGFDPNSEAKDAMIALDVRPPIADAIYATANDELFTVDASTGVATVVGKLDCVAAAGDLALSTDGELVMVSGETLYVVDPATARCAPRGGLTDVSAPLGGLAFVRGASGDVLLGGTKARPGKLYSVDPGTARTDEIGSYGGGYFSRGDLAMTLGHGLLGSVTDDAGGDFLARIEIDTGTATILGPTVTMLGLVAIGDELHGFGPDGSISRIDPDTGAVLTTSASDHGWTGVALAPP